MSEILKYIRNILGIGVHDDRSYIQSRKRRLISEEYENFSSKLRRLNERKMSHNIDDWTDLPSTSKSTFLKHPHRRQNIRPLTMRSFNTEVIDLSDDDDVLDITPQKNTVLGISNGHSSSSSRSKSPDNVFKEAKKTIYKCNRFLNGNHGKSLNETIRLDEQQMYRDMLLNSPRTSDVYSHNVSTPERRRDYFDNSRSKKILSMLNDKKISPLIDLTDEKSSKAETIVVKDSSDSDSDTTTKQKVQPVNSLKKMLDTEPFMNPNYLSKMQHERELKKTETERLIKEERLKRDKFSNVNRENISLLLEYKLKHCKISDVILLDEYPEEEEELNLPDFTAEQESKINEALKPRNPNRVFSEKYNLRITGNDLKLFNEKQWLNDEVINFYVNMIQERSERPNLPKVYSFSTFFYPKLVSNGYSSLRRWTKRVDIFSYDIIIVPVHLGFHWCMAVIDFRDKSIRYYDSMLGKNMVCLTALENYLREEHMDKKKQEYDTSNWKKVIMTDIPRQMNGSDCGVFSCTFAEFITRNAKILFKQEHMPYIRRKMVIEIIEGRLIT